MDEKQSRSVFVGNIPHGTSEDQMRDVFSVVGPVVSFRIVYDRETGNPKGYGFAEYQDTQTAQSAMRNLNGFEFNGRSLRVDKASSQADELRMMHQQSGGPPVEQVYGDPVPVEEAPDTISRAVAGLPPEQMFELMKQVKECVTRNPLQARMMLLQNPQLAYAILQAQVVMRIVDPQMAVSLLYQPPIDEQNSASVPGSMPLSAPPGAKDPSSTMAAVAAAAAAAAAAAGFSASDIPASSVQMNPAMLSQPPPPITQLPPPPPQSATSNQAAMAAAAFGASANRYSYNSGSNQLHHSMSSSGYPSDSVNSNQLINNPHDSQFQRPDDPNELMMRYVNMSDQEMVNLTQAQRDAIYAMREQLSGRRSTQHRTSSSQIYAGRRK